MEITILEYAMEKGLWAVLAVALLFFLLRSQERRSKEWEEKEKSHQEILKQLLDRTNTISKIEEHILKIMNSMDRNK